MENNKETIENDLRNESGLKNEILSAMIYEQRLGSSISGRSYQVPDTPKRYIEPTILDTSLPYIPVYIHLKIHDLKPIERQTTPPILSELRMKCSYRDDYMVPESYRSSKASLSTRRTSKGKSSLTLNLRESEKNL